MSSSLHQRLLPSQRLSHFPYLVSGVKTFLSQLSGDAAIGARAFRSSEARRIVLVPNEKACTKKAAGQHKFSISRGYGEDNWPSALFGEKGKRMPQTKRGLGEEGGNGEGKRMTLPKDEQKRIRSQIESCGFPRTFDTTGGLICMAQFYRDGRVLNVRCLGFLGEKRGEGSVKMENGYTKKKKRGVGRDRSPTISNPYIYI